MVKLWVCQSKGLYLMRSESANSSVAMVDSLHGRYRFIGRVGFTRSTTAR